MLSRTVLIMLQPSRLLLPYTLSRMDVIMVWPPDPPASGCYDVVCQHAPVADVILSRGFRT